MTRATLAAMRRLVVCALLSCLLFGGLPALGQSAPGTAEAVGGRVESAKGGRPIAHAQVSLVETARNRTVATVNAGEDGRFRFEPVPPGKYRLEGQATGFLQAAYQQHGPLSTAIVTGAGLPVGDLVLSLTPAASITGRLLDENGDPIPHATLTLFRQDLANGTQAVHTLMSSLAEDDGSFEFGPLQPGRYFLAANGTPWYAVHPPVEQDGNRQAYRSNVDPALDVAYPTLFYPNARSSEEASPLDLGPGDTFTANLQMLPTRAVTLILRRPPAPAGQPRQDAIQQMPQLSQTAFGTEQMNANSANVLGLGDEVVVQGLAPGRYDVQMQQFGQGFARLAGSAGSVDLTGGSVTMDEASPAPRSTISVTVHTSDGSDLPRNTVLYLTNPDRSGRNRQNFGNASVDAKGQAELNDVPAGDVRLSASGGGRNLPIAGISVDEHPVTGTKLHVGGGAHLLVSVTLAKGAANLEGVVQRDGKPAAAELVLLVPAGADTALELFRRDQSDLDGSFRLPQVPPGRYLLVALHDGWNLPWSDLHAITPYLLGAQPVTVPAGATGAIRLPEPLGVQTVR